MIIYTIHIDKRVNMTPPLDLLIDLERKILENLQDNKVIFNMKRN